MSYNICRHKVAGGYAFEMRREEIPALDKSGVFRKVKILCDEYTTWYLYVVDSADVEKAESTIKKLLHNITIVRQDNYIYI